MTACTYCGHDRHRGLSCEHDCGCFVFADGSGNATAVALADQQAREAS